MSFTLYKPIRKILNPGGQTVHQTAQAVLDDLRTGGDQFKEQQDDSESQTMQFEHRAQVSAFQVKAIFFEIAEHFFNPHAPFITLSVLRGRRQIGGQQPGFFFAISSGQDIHRIGVQLGQLSLTQPKALPVLVSKLPKRDPGRLIVFSHQMRAFLRKHTSSH